LKNIKYFFYITNHTEYGAEQTVALANERCEQENVIEQLKNGVNAMRMPVDDLISNSAYIVKSALAWNLKSWYGLLMPNRQRRLELVMKEFRRFLHAIVLLPAQIVRSGRKIIYRIMGYNSWLKDFFAAWEIFVGWHLLEGGLLANPGCSSRNASNVPGQKLCLGEPSIGAQTATTQKHLVTFCQPEANLDLRSPEPTGFAPFLAFRWPNQKFVTLHSEHAYFGN
jgi:hypothetical protein